MSKMGARAILVARGDACPSCLSVLAIGESNWCDCFVRTHAQCPYCGLELTPTGCDACGARPDDRSLPENDDAD